MSQIFSNKVAEGWLDHPRFELKSIACEIQETKNTARRKTAHKTLTGIPRPPRHPHSPLRENAPSPKEMGGDRPNEFEMRGTNDPPPPVLQRHPFHASYTCVQRLLENGWFSKLTNAPTTKQHISMWSNCFVENLVSRLRIFFIAPMARST